VTTVELPNVAAILGDVLRRVPVSHRPLLIALAERMAAERYRAWAKEACADTRASQLLACASREEEIARRVESLYPEAASVQRDLLAKNPDLEEINISVFAKRPLDEQFAIQAQGERAGAAIWSSMRRLRQRAWCFWAVPTSRKRAPSTWSLSSKGSDSEARAFGRPGESPLGTTRGEVAGRV